jgi:magnesium chelatase subunit D
LEDLSAPATRAERRSRKTIISSRGRFRRAVPLAPGETLDGVAVAVSATLRRYALRRARGGPDHLTPEDLCRQERHRPSDRLILFVLDTSESMGDNPEQRIRAAKGAVFALLRKAYQNRSEVALIAFGGEQATVVLPPTRSIVRARVCLERLPVGGATPFADGLYQAWRLVRRERIRRPGVQPLLVIISDGEANVTLTPGVPPEQELLDLAAQLRAEKVASVLFDVSTVRGKTAELLRLAGSLGGSHMRVSDLRARDLLAAVPT